MARGGPDLLARLFRQPDVARAATAGVCVTVTLIDGMALARSGLEHSVNFRSVMVFGRAEVVEGFEAKTAHLRSLKEHVFPGR